MQDNNCDNTCKCGYDDVTFMESFAMNETDIKKCNECPSFQYSDGIMFCKKFNKE